MSETFSFSDHHYVSFRLNEGPLDVCSGDEEHGHGTETGTPGWAVRQMNANALRLYLRSTDPNVSPLDDPAEAAVESLNTYLTGACNASTPVRTEHPRRKRPVHWWNEEIADLRRRCNASRRRYVRRARHSSLTNPTNERETFRADRKALRIAIRASQERSWAALCTAVENNPWGLPYRVVTRKIGRRRPGAEARGREPEIADHLFPSRPVTYWPDPETGGSGDAVADFVPPFSAEELACAAKRLPKNKAPGPDGIPNEVIAHVSIVRPDILLSTYNACLDAGRLPRRWKRARLVLLHKGPD